MERSTAPATLQDTALSRRTLLRGVGAALALPFLEAMAPATRGLATLHAAGSSTTKAPVRMAFLFVPNGVNMEHWLPAAAVRDGDGRNSERRDSSRRGGGDGGAVGASRLFELPSILDPLGDLKGDILVLQGLAHDKGRANGDGAGDHARSASSFLTGAQPVKTFGAGIRVGVSVDQVAASAIGRNTRFPSLEIACEEGGNAGNCDSGYSCAYSSNISWASPTTPMTPEIDPRRVFDRLFSTSRADVAGLGGDDHQARAERRKASILDYVRDDARRLGRRLGASDRRKVDEYLTSIREVEKRLARFDGIPGQEDIEAPDGLPDRPGVQLDYSEHIRLHCDILALAFRADLTRVASFLFAREGSNRNYRLIDIPDGHHDLSHHQGDKEKLDKIRRINRFHTTQLAYFLEKLRSIPEGDGCLLDNCMVVYGSGIGDGNRHNHDNLPVLLAGRGGGTIDPGRLIRYEPETPMCNLFLSLLDRMGVRCEEFGDSTGRVRHLEV